MDNSEKAKLIVKLVKMKLEQGVENYIKARADLAKAQMGHGLWEKENKDNLGFGRNPFQMELAQKRVDHTRKEKDARQELLDYAVEVFLSKID